MMKLRFAAVLCSLLVVWSTLAKGPKITDPKEAGKDFAIQGEYVGELPGKDGKQKIGVQVIAMGSEKFHAVAYHGGLPGAGYDGEKKIEIDGELKDGEVLLKTDMGNGIIKDGAITILDTEGNQLGTLKKVIRKSPTLGQKPPEGAVVLFDGNNADHFNGGKLSEDGYLMAGTTSKQTFGNHRIHIEFRLPYQPEDRGQGRGNSGIYVQGRYEVQMLDSFGLAGKQNECGGLYSVKDPDRNMCFPPLSWQTYDIDYTAATFDAEGKLKTNPRITVRHNGVVIHDDVELPGERNTTAAPSKPGPQPGPVYLQNHGCPVVYRNIWVVEKK